MPICLNCGKDIPVGQKYCDDCAALSRQRPPDYLSLPSNAYVPPARSNGHAWIWVGGVVILALLIGLAYGMMSMLPAEEISKKQAQRCRERMESVSGAVNDYVGAKGELPPEGRVDKGSALMTGGYLKEPLRCPSTEHYYIIKYEDGKALVFCDSKLKGHELK